MRFFRHKYLIFISFLLLFVGGISAGAYADVSPSIEGTSVVTNDSTPAANPCSNTLTEEDTKKFAQTAASSVNETRKGLSQINTFVENDYKAANGVCHFIEGSSAKWWQELFTSAVTPFNDHAISGAKKGDALVPSLKLEENVNWINSNNDYLDWDFPELLKRVNTTKHAIDTVNSWRSIENGGHASLTSEIVGPLSTFNADFSGCTNLTKISGMQWKCNESGRVINFETLLKSMENISKCHEKLNQVVENRSSMMANRKKAHNLLSAISDEVEIGACTCKEGTDEKEMCSVLDTDIEEDDVKNCLALSEYQNELKNCILCNLMRTILSAVQNIAQKSFDALAKPLISLVGLGFALYLAYIVLTIIASPATQKLSALLNPVLMQGFNVALAILLLSAPATIYDLAVSPIIDTGIDFGVSLSGDENIGKIKQNGARYIFSEESSDYLKSDILKKTVGAAAAFNENAAMIPAIGRSLMCNAWNNIFFEILPNVEMWIDGLILYVFGIIISFVVGFYLLDACVQLGILCALMPFLIASWAFKMTRTYASRGWDILMNTFFNFVMMGVIIVSVTEILLHSLSGDVPLDTLKDYLNANDVDALNKTIDFGGLQMILLLVCCAISLKLIREIPSLTSKVSGHSGLGLGIGNMIGGAAMSQFKGAAASTVKIGAKAAGAGLKRGGAEAAKLGEASGALGALRAGGNAVKNFVSRQSAGNQGGRQSGGQGNNQGASQRNDQNEGQQNNGGQEDN